MTNKESDTGLYSVSDSVTNLALELVWVPHEEE